MSDKKTFLHFYLTPLLVSVCLICSTTALGQVEADTSDYTIDIADWSLAEALTLVADETGIDLAYAPEMVVGKRTSCTIETNLASDLLICVLGNTGLEARQLSVGAWLIQQRKEVEPKVSSAPAYGVISGVVRASHSYEGVAGAHVVVRNTFLGDVADAEGTYVIERVPAGNYVLITSCIGFESERLESIEVTPGDTVSIPVELEEVPLILDQLIVIAGYDRFTQRVAHSIPVKFQSVGLAGYGFGLFVAASPAEVTKFQLSTFGNLAASDLRGAQISAGVNYAGGNADGVQMSAIGNRAGLRMHGAQLAGVFNTASGEVRGTQMAGVSNVAWAPVHGLQAAGAVNVTADRMQGVQLAGAVNAAGKVTGNQIAGAVNYGYRVIGGQVAGAVNVSAGTFDGFQVAGAVNVSSGPLFGSQISGVANLATGSVDGPQVGGVINVAAGGVQGVQVAGVVNVAGKDVVGSQISGVLNVAKSVTGVQIGLVNISQHNEGLPIGLFSYVGDVGLGYDVWVDETGLITTALRGGNSRISSYLGIGYRPGADVHRWAPVAGIGIEDELTRSLVVLFDGLYHHFDLEKGDFNQLVRARLMLGFRPVPQFMIYAGPTYNLYTGDHIDGSDLAPWSDYEGSWGPTYYRSWAGVTFGVRIKP